MKILLRILFVFIFLAAGVVAGFFLSPNEIYPVLSPVAQTVGMTVPGAREAVGFFPYWLLGKGKASYGGYLTESTYFGMVVNEDGTLQKKVNDAEEEPGWTTLKGEKTSALLDDAKKGKMKTSFLVHSASEDAIAAMMAEPEKSADNLTADAIPIMKQYGFSDLNLDIESFVEATPGAQAAMTAFVARVRKNMNAAKAGTVSMDIAPIAVVKPRLIDVPAVVPFIDRLILMAYDYHYTGSYVAGAVAPVEGKDTDREFDITSVLKKLTTILPRNRIILGIPLYGYEWDTLTASPSAATVPGSGITASAKRIAEELAACGSCIKGIDATARQPYVAIPTNGYFRLVYYEDKASMTEKLNLARRFDIGGIALWAMGYEDDSILEPVKDYIRYRD